jgi:sec-independent protein translocase protein TatA
VIALLVLGPQRLPDAARAVGRGVREFRTALDTSDDDEDDDYADDAPTTTRSSAGRSTT